jgi:antitoxin VapB
LVKEDIKRNEVLGKLHKLRDIIGSEHLSGILITQQSNVCWLTAGANNHVLFDYQDSLIGILITDEEVYVIAENGDHDRVIDEEFSHCPFQYRRIGWYSGGIGVEASKLQKGRIGVDAAVGGIAEQVPIDGHLMHCRSVLVPSEIERLREYGREASSIITSVAKRTGSGIKESEVAAMLAHEFINHQFNTSVILIGGDRRSLKYRHQVVTDYVIKKHYSFCGVGKKGGLTYPINRIVSFGEPPEALQRDQEKIETVYVYLNSLATIGTSLKSIYLKLPEIYGSAGLGSEEWKNHTQGGTMGYHPREQTVSAYADYTLRENNVIGWNPSLPGVMAEDVYLLKKEGLEYITYDENFPHRELTANELTQVRPSILVL